LAGVNAEGAAPRGLEDSLTGSLELAELLAGSMTELRSLGPCNPPLDIRRTGGVDVNVLRFESIWRTMLGVVLVGELDLEGIFVAGVTTVIAGLIDLTGGTLGGIVFVSLGLFAGRGIGVSMTT
jgi:hypothetical protein